MSEPTLLAALTMSLLRAAEAAGADAAALRAAAGLDAEELRDPDARIPLSRHMRLLVALGGPAAPAGLEIGRRLGAEALGVVGYALQHDATLGSALRWLERYRAVVIDDVIPRMERDAGSILFAHALPPPIARLREPAELWAAAQLALLRRLVGRELAPLEVALPHPAPADLAAHRAYFGCPLRWEAPRVEVRFDAAVLDLPLARSDADLFRYLSRRAEALASELPESSPLARARRLVEEALPHGEPELDAIARRLGTSARTLQRRLGEAGIPFSRLLDEVRRERAELLLRDERLTVGAVAFLLGYSEPAAFFRAFRRWTGTTPRAWRASSAA